MSFEAGARVGVYEIVGQIGAGGMGEVYRARDTKLHRDVAIKVLPPLFAADPDRLARFEREAQTLASLNHPHVAQIYGVVEQPAALVMEFVDGEDLALRISRGPVPIDEALGIARQIADALEAAHERGIVHRDLKPANVKLRPDGTVKVLDFGLAKAVSGGSDNFSAANSPTFTSPALLSNLGLILGTAAYMSPEQAKGKPVDRRADLWAFGAVLFEMLTGRAAFGGETVTDVLAAIVTRDPDWTLLPAATPPHVRRLLARCLTRDPRTRLADAGEARFQLGETSSPEPPVAAPPRPATVRGRAAATLWSVVVLLASAAGWLAWEYSRVPAPLALRYAIETPSKTTVSTVARPAIALSPDGTTVAYVGRSAGILRLYVRTQSEFESRVLSGTEGASEPVFSPDGQWIAFFAGTKLNKIPAAGGTVETIAEVNDPRGLSWDVPEVITYSPQSVGEVFEIAPSAGASPKPITKLVSGVERTHRWAQRLPNGATIFTVGSLTSPDNYDNASVDVLNPKTGQRKSLLKGASMARYAPPGYLLYVRGAALFAVPFNLDRLEVSGTAVPVAKMLAGDSTTGAANFAFANGTFAYIPGAAETAQHRLVWMDRNGRTEPVDLQPGLYFDVSISPDGGRAALTAAGSGGTDVWVYDFGRRTFTRLTFGGSHRTPIWSHDGSELYYVKLAPDGTSNNVMRKPADGSREEEPVFSLKRNTYLRDITADGRVLLIDHNSNLEKSDIATIATTKDAKAVPLVATPFDEYAVKWSPDHRFIAYQSDESSRMEIYVREASGQGGRWQVSTSGGEEPRWSADGRELYYRADTQMMAVPIDPGPTFRSGTPRQLFDGVYNLRVESGNSYDVDPKGGPRFLMIRLAEDAAPPTSIRVALNWTSELTRLVQGK